VPTKIKGTVSPSGRISASKPQVAWQ
jgi:hypothetical protein